MRHGVWVRDVDGVWCVSEVWRTETRVLGFIIQFQTHHSAMWRGWNCGCSWGYCCCRTVTLSAPNSKP